MLRLFDDGSFEKEALTDWSVMGKMCEEIKDYDSGLSYYNTALKKDMLDDERQQVMLRQAKIYKKKNYYGSLFAFITFLLGNVTLVNYLIYSYGLLFAFIFNKFINDKEFKEED